MNQRLVKKALLAVSMVGFALAGIVPLPAGAQQSAPSPIRVIARGPATTAVRGAGLFNLTDRNDKACTLQTIQCGQTVSGTLASTDCGTTSGSYADLYQFAGTSGQTVTITERSTGFDSYLALFNPQSQDVAENNNGGGGNDAQLVVQLNSTGNWQIAATSNSAAETGAYTLTLNCSGTGTGTAPAAPSKLQATAVSSTEIDLTWQDNSNNETGFAVDSLISGVFQQIGTVGANVVRAGITQLSPQTSYTFRVRALNGSASSGPSNQVTATTPAGSGGGGGYLTTPAIPNFRFKVRIFNSTTPTAGTMESDCIPETLCVSGALAGRSEVFVRVVGPRPNGYLWPTLVRFTPSRVEVDVQQISTGITKTYVLPAVPSDSDELSGLQDRTGFQP
jgi:hypothetical protein